MTASLQSPADIVNAALRHAGTKYRVGNLLDGSEAAKMALDIYAQSRDALLKSQSWQFAQKINASLSGITPAIFPWAYTYALPTDFLVVRSLMPSTAAIPELNPQDILFSIFNDASASPTRVLVTNQASPTLLYTAQITDMTQWDVSFVEALIDELASILLPVLGDARLAQLTEARAAGGKAAALESTGAQAPNEVPAMARENPQ
jgi:hypothetical protein